ncbi:MAG TPA: hypothetical protein VJ578_03665 [Dehalococcoidia bacterium]|nr:hypothetical protein [Dehalococcoidia bacterium]
MPAVKLFRRRKPENGEAEDELAFDADAAEEDPGQETAEAALDAAAGVAADAGPILAPLDPLAQMRADAAAEAAAAETPSEGAAPSPNPDDPLDAGLMDLFREANNEVQESTLASDLEDIPIQDLLSDLVSVSECLGITPRARPRPKQDRALDSDPELRQAGK